MDRKPLLSQRALLGAGQPIGRLMAQALAYPQLISLAAGFVDNATLPCEEVVSSMQRLASDESRLRRALQYGTTEGSQALRESILDWNYADFPENRPTADRMILTAGSNQLLHLLSEAVLDPGDIVITAAPTYFVYLGTLHSMGAKTIGVKADEHGISISALTETLESIRRAGHANRVKLIYCVTDFDNPGGSTLSLERRNQLLEVVSRWRREQNEVLLISDNAYEHLRYDGERLPPILSLAREAAEYTIELGTFSKVFSPGIRVGWGVVPKQLVPWLLDLKANIDFGSSHFAQVLVQDALHSGSLVAHLPTIRDGYKRKRDAMAAALNEHISQTPGVKWCVPNGGLYIWLRLPIHVDASESGELWKKSTENGVLYVPGHYCYPEAGQPVERNTMRLSFGVQSAESIRKGIERLADAIRQVA